MKLKDKHLKAIKERGLDMKAFKVIEVTDQYVRVEHKEDSSLSLRLWV